MLMTDNFKSKNDLDNEKMPLIKIHDIIIPSIPFLWYREQQLMCPIEFIGKFKYDKIKNIINIPDII